MLIIMINRMINKTDEVILGLCNWVRTFNIHRFDGENVSIAIGQCKAVIRAVDVQ